VDKFDQFDFIAYLAPGGLLLLAYCILWRPHSLPFGDATTAVAFAIASYAVGHMAGALGAALELLIFRRIGPRALAGKNSEAWIVRNLDSDQTERFIALLETRLLRVVPGHELKNIDYRHWRNIARQIYIDTASQGRARRVDIFNRLYAFYRGLAAASSITVLMLVVFSLERWDLSPLWYLIPLLAVVGGCASQMRSFTRLYTSELLQQFLLLPKNSPDAR